MKLDSSGASYEYYREECDGVDGCNNSTCTAVLGWKCTQNLVAHTSTCT
jgi:hypothetical protein